MEAYQFSKHTAFGLDDELKLVKCNALLLEADEKTTEDAKPLLQQCESLLAVMTGTQYSHDKEKILVKLAGHYAKTDPDHAYSIAQRLTFYAKMNPDHDYSITQHLVFFDYPFDAAQSIQKQQPDFPDFDKTNSVY